MPTRPTALSLALATAALVCPAQETTPSKYLPIQLAWDLKIPMRDGVRLSATVYRNPKEAKPLPVILTMTPYIAEHAARQGVYFSQNGYVFVAVDSRGRGNSEGIFHPGQVEGKDGFDAVEWIAKQPWCDGQVAMWGGSWLGFTQWSTAKEFPPHLKAIAPSASVHPGVDYPQPHGIFLPYMLQWLSYVHGKALNSGVFNERALWTNARWQLIEEGRAFEDLESLTGISGTDFSTWLKHPTEDSFWRAMTPGKEHYQRISIPVLTITGHFDGDQLGALTYFDRHMAWGSPNAKNQHFLIVGPWDHSGTRRPKPELGGVTFGKEADLNMEELHKAWYDHVLKGGPKPNFFKDRVACFVMGTNQWTYASDLTAFEKNPSTLHLDLSNAVVGDVLRSGQMGDKEGPAEASVLLNTNPREPLDRADLEGEDPNFFKDQRLQFRTSDHSVTLHGAPLREATVLSGRPELRLRVSVDQPDGDLRATLFEVLQDGSVVYLTSTAVRLRYRLPGRESLMKPGVSELVTFPRFQFFARSLAKGSRIRLVVTSQPSSYVQRNTHTGGNLASEPLKNARVATFKLITGPGSQSALTLPKPDPSTLPARQSSTKGN